MAADLQAPAFTDDDAARKAIEAELWPNGPVCPRCGGMDRIGKVSGKTARPGLYNCAACKRQFTVTVGTIFERSKVPLSKWWAAIHLLAASKKGISSHQLMRMLGVSYPTAWFMSHRIREAMQAGSFATPMGGDGAVVEIDETFIGQKKDMPKQRGYAHKHAVMTLVERGKGSRSFHVEGTSAADLLPIIKAHVHPDTYVMTDEAGQYIGLGKHFTGHESVNHGKGEYVRKDVHTNTLEGVVQKVLGPGYTERRRSRAGNGIARLGCYPDPNHAAWSVVRAGRAEAVPRRFVLRAFHASQEGKECQPGRWQRPRVGSGAKWGDRHFGICPAAGGGPQMRPGGYDGWA